MEGGGFMKKDKRFYLALVIFCLTGQVAWTVENMYFNVFIYKMFHASASEISMMVAASAVAATVTTLLIGALSSGFLLAVFLANAGGAWDNAKKYVEEGNFGGKGSEVHKATVVGDTVGDPFKDTSGPSLNILIKLMSMVAIVMAGLTVAWSIF